MKGVLKLRSADTLSLCLDGTISTPTPAGITGLHGGRSDGVDLGEHYVYTFESGPLRRTGSGMSLVHLSVRNLSQRLRFKTLHTGEVGWYWWRCPSVRVLKRTVVLPLPNILEPEEKSNTEPLLRQLGWGVPPPQTV